MNIWKYLKSVQDGFCCFWHHFKKTLENLNLIGKDPERFFQWLLTGKWNVSYHRSIESKMDSMQWKISLKKYNVEKFVDKVMATVFWAKKELLPLEFISYKYTIKGKTYASTIKALRDSIKQKKSGKLISNALFLHGNTPVHMCAIAQAAIWNWVLIA